MMRHSWLMRAQGIAIMALLAVGMAGCGLFGKSDEQVTSSKQTESSKSLSKKKNKGTHKSNDINISYTTDTDLAFSNNKILLVSASGASKDEVEQVLSKYGTVDGSHADAGMYAVGVSGHMTAKELSDLIDRIVREEPLIEHGSINWSLPDQPEVGADTKK